jgi:HAD superfamily hydrolase (TIGR01549 family)
MPDDRITAVLFDLGDTILNFGRVNTTRAFLQGARATHAYLREHGQRVAAFPWYFVVNLVRLRLRYLIANVTHRDFNSLEVLQTVGARKGVKLSPQQWEQFAWLWYEPLSRCAQVEEDIKQTLDRLRSLGLKLGIVSNTFVSRFSLEKHLEMLGILDFFTMQLYSHEVDVRKPSREIFRIAAERIGEPVTKILVVGDRIDNDIRPALENGMIAVLKEAYTNTGKNPPPGALRVRRLSELPALIESLNATAETGSGNS